MLNITPPSLLGQTYSWPPMFTEVPPGDPWHASLSSCSVGWLAELAGSTVSLEDAGWTVSLEDSGPAAELVVSAEELVVVSVALAGIEAAEELLDSAAADNASMTELLMGSWLRGMSTTLLELLA